MIKNIFSVIIGNNRPNLNGSNNDAIKIYNLIYKYLNINIKIQKPLLYTDDKIININEIKNEIKKIHSLNLDDYTIIFFYAGHGYNNRIRFCNLSGEGIIDLINYGLD